MFDSLFEHKTSSLAEAAHAAGGHVTESQSEAAQTKLQSLEHGASFRLLASAVLAYLSIHVPGFALLLPKFGVTYWGLKDAFAKAAVHGGTNAAANTGALMQTLSAGFVTEARLDHLGQTFGAAFSPTIADAHSTLVEQGSAHVTFAAHADATHPVSEHHDLTPDQLVLRDSIAKDLGISPDLITLEPDGSFGIEDAQGHQIARVVRVDSLDKGTASWYEHNGGAHHTYIVETMPGDDHPMETARKLVKLKAIHEGDTIYFADHKNDDYLGLCYKNNQLLKVNFDGTWVCHGHGCPVAETVNNGSAAAEVVVPPPDAPVTVTLPCTDAHGHLTGKVLTILEFPNKEAALDAVRHGTPDAWYTGDDGLIHRVTHVNGQVCDVVEKVSVDGGPSVPLAGTDVAAWYDQHGFFPSERQAIVMNPDGTWHYMYTPEQEADRTLAMYGATEAGVDPDSWNKMLALPTPDIFADPHATLEQCTQALLDEAKANGIPLDPSGAHNLAVLIREGQTGETPLHFNDAGTAAGAAFDDVPVTEDGHMRPLGSVLHDVARNGVVTERTLAGAGH